MDLGHKDGVWVLLQNVHLMPSFLKELEKKLDTMALEGSNPTFRLFVTSDPANSIPIGLLEKSIKLTNEPPVGVRLNLQNAFTYFDKEYFEEIGDARVKTILFALCYFHTVMTERRKFGPKGWNMRYPFNMGDLRDSNTILNNYLESNASSGKVPWDDLKYLFGEIMYGGHIVNDWDRILCSAYLDDIMKDELLEEKELFPFIEGKNMSFRCP
jgi:dynein heavy chain